jgi:hypothetical protein
MRAGAQTLSPNLVSSCQSAEIFEKSQKKGLVKVWRDSKADFCDLKAKNPLCYLLFV